MIAGRLRWLERDGEAAGADHARDLRVRERHARVHRSRHEAPRVAALRRAARRRSRRSTPADSRSSTPTLAAFAARLTSENHTLEARADRSAPLRRHRQRLLRRDPASRPAVADRAHREARRTPRSRGSSRRPAPCSPNGSSGCARRRAARFRRRSPRSGPEMAVHGRFGKPCPVCGAPVQRIVYAENECNYCARCQTGGVILADRALSRLLHKSWPRSIDELGVTRERRPFRGRAIGGRLRRSALLQAPPCPRSTSSPK